MNLIDIFEDRHPFHTLTRPSRYGAWGSSHQNSRLITGDAARLAGVAGYDTMSTSKVGQRLAKSFLKAIFNSPGSPEPLYHGFKNRAGRQFRVGEVIDLPLAATSGSLDDSAGYGITNARDVEAVVFAFPKGTPMAGYAHWKKQDAKDFGHTWAEALVGGRFRVTGISQRTQYDWHDSPQITVVNMQPIAVFDPDTKQWKTV